MSSYSSSISSFLACLFLITILISDQSSHVLAANGTNSMCATVITTTQFSTMKANGFTYFIGNYFDGSKVTEPDKLGSPSCNCGLYKGVNFNGIKSIKNAETAAITQLRDAYHIPRYTPSKAIGYPGLPASTTNIYGQCRKPIDYMQNTYKATIGRTWLVVMDGWGSNWDLADKAKNFAFIDEFVKYFPGTPGTNTYLGAQIGILTDEANYELIVGSGAPALVDSNGLPLQYWWAKCDTGRQDYYGFIPHNGWATPVMHRHLCNVNPVGNAPGAPNGDHDWFA